MSGDTEDPGSPGDEEEDADVDYEKLRPTYAHEALALLMERGLVHYIVSQNCDGLHLLSGVSPDRISELHGNVFVEKCSCCQKRYQRSVYVLHDEASQYYEDLEDYGETDVIKPKFAVECELCGLCHRTGRRCEKKVRFFSSFLICIWVILWSWVPFYGMVQIAYNAFQITD